MGAAQSEAAHGYTTAGTSEPTSASLSYEGEHREAYLDDDGRRVTGESSFTLAVHPANTGVTLRRRFEAARIEEAAVYVDGSYAGRWRSVGGNQSGRWKDSELRLPAALTAGRTSVRVRVVSAAPWGDSRIWALSRMPNAPLPPPPGPTRNLVNADFEDGTTQGWATSGQAFAPSAVVTQTVQNGVPFGQHGTFHLWGYAATGNDTATGTMTTPDFVLGGDGRIDLLVAGGRDLGQIGVAVVRAADGRVVFRATGKKLRGLHPGDVRRGFPRRHHGAARRLRQRHRRLGPRQCRRSARTRRELTRRRGP